SSSTSWMTASTFPSRPSLRTTANKSAMSATVSDRSGAKSKSASSTMLSSKLKVASRKASASSYAPQRLRKTPSPSQLLNQTSNQPTKKNLLPVPVRYRPPPAKDKPPSTFPPIVQST